MSCLYHSDRSAVNTCSKCGAWLCDGCSVEIEGRIICKPCIAREMQGGARDERGYGEHGYGGYGRGRHPHGRYADERSHGVDPRAVFASSDGRERGSQHVNAFWLLCFSALPGANYMCMGLIKRGLCTMAAFFGSIYMTAMFGGAPFVFLIPILVITSMFDGFRIRRLINAGVKVDDGIDDVRTFVREHRMLLLVAVLVMFGMQVLRSLGGIVGGVLFLGSSTQHLMPWALIGLGCYFLFRRKGTTPRESKGEEREQYIDKR